MRENSTPRFLVDGERASTLPVTDRGLQFGDGVFETIAVRGGAPVRLERHLDRLSRGLDALGIRFDDLDRLRAEALDLCRKQRNAVLKLIVTRGRAGPGYAPFPESRPTRILGLHPAPGLSAERWRDGVRVRWCETRLARNPQLAGIKHLNRLEQVMARSEWSDPAIAEGLVRDTEGLVIEATACNLFAVSDGDLFTPELDQCGVAGIMRAVMMERAERAGRPVRVAALTPEKVEAADELFLTNSLVGIWPVAELAGKPMGPGPVTRELMATLDDAI